MCMARRRHSTTCHHHRTNYRLSDAAAPAAAAHCYITTYNARITFRYIYRAGEQTAAVSLTGVTASNNAQPRVYNLYTCCAVTKEP